MSHSGGNFICFYCWWEPGMVSKEKPAWQQLLAKASIFCLNLEALKPPGVGGYEGLVIWQLFLLWRGRSRVSQQSSSPELLSGSEGGAVWWEVLWAALARAWVSESLTAPGEALADPSPLCCLLWKVSVFLMQWKNSPFIPGLIFSHFRVLSWFTVQPDQRQRWLRAGDGGVESRGGADPCPANCSFLFLVTVTSLLPLLRFLVTLFCPMAGEVGTRWSQGPCQPKPYWDSGILELFSSRLVKPSPNKTFHTVEARVSDGCCSLSIMIFVA